MSANSAVEAFLARLLEGWRARRELEGLEPNELERVAGEFGMTASDLEELAAKGKDAARLLNERLQALGLTRQDVEEAASGLMADLEKTCSRCKDKGVCEKDLARRPDDAVWENYCPNAGDLGDILHRLKERLPAS